MIMDLEDGRRGIASQLLCRLSASIGHWRTRRRAVRRHRRAMSVLAALDDHLLCDLGLSRAQIEDEAALPKRPRVFAFLMR